MRVTAIFFAVFCALFAVLNVAAALMVGYWFNWVVGAACAAAACLHIHIARELRS